MGLSGLQGLFGLMKRHLLIVAIAASLSVPT